MKEWLENEAINILKNFGLKKGQIVVDFGCGKGIYSIIAAKIVGNAGKVYALDSDEEGLLNELYENIEKENIKNIEIIKTTGEIRIPLENDSVDFVLIYDVVHLLNNDERIKLFKEISRVLKNEGIVSYHATHLGGKYDVNLEQVHELMKREKLYLIQKFQVKMFHWAWIEDSIVFNYKKLEK